MAEGIYIAQRTLCPVPIVQMSESENDSGPPGFSKVTGGTIYFLYSSPVSSNLKAELTIISEFLAKWNTDAEVSPLFALHCWY